MCHPTSLEAQPVARRGSGAGQQVGRRASARLLRRPWPHPPVKSKYNPLQRIAYLAMPLLGVLAVASGWAMHKPVQLKWLDRRLVGVAQRSRRV